MQEVKIEVGEIELKPCPFCGHKAFIEHRPIEPSHGTIEKGDMLTRWKVYCPNCGVEKRGGLTYYRFNNDETIRIFDKRYDGRKEAIKDWNRRATNET